MEQLREEVRELRSMLETVLEHTSKIDRLEAKLSEALFKDVEKKDLNALRRKVYRDKKEAELKGRFALPDFQILRKRDSRLLEKAAAWADVGMEFGAANDGPGFLRWLTWTWNSKTYVKKPITFSGGSFHMWNGSCRHPYSVGDLMHLYRKRIKMVPFFRDTADYQDFQDRPWWMWGSYVLAPVIREMKMRPKWRRFTEGFKRCVQLLIGGFAELYVEQVGVNWDFHESRANLDKMMKHLAPVYLRVLNACADGLRGADEPKRPAN